MEFYRVTEAARVMFLAWELGNGPESHGKGAKMDGNAMKFIGNRPFSLDFNGVGASPGLRCGETSGHVDAAARAYGAWARGGLLLRALACMSMLRPWL